MAQTFSLSFAATLGDSIIPETAIPRMRNTVYMILVISELGADGQHAQQRWQAVPQQQQAALKEIAILHTSIDDLPCSINFTVLIVFFNI